MSPHTECLTLQALNNQQKAVLMSERVLGIEHPNTIQEYVSVKTKPICTSRKVIILELSEHYLCISYRCTWLCTALLTASCPLH